MIHNILLKKCKGGLHWSILNILIKLFHKTSTQRKWKQIILTEISTSPVNVKRSCCNVNIFNFRLIQQTNGNHWDGDKFKLVIRTKNCLKFEFKFNFNHKTLQNMINTSTCPSLENCVLNFVTEFKLSIFCLFLALQLMPHDNNNWFFNLFFHQHYPKRARQTIKDFYGIPSRPFI